MAEKHEDRVREMEERSKELEREIEETEQGWEKTKKDVPSADPEEAADEDDSGAAP